MLEAQERGHRVLYAEPADLGVDRRGASWPARARCSAAPGGAAATSTWASPASVALDEEVDLVFQRKDPPVDAALRGGHPDPVPCAAGRWC